MALASSVGVGAETWPAKAMRIIVPFPAGSSPEGLSNLMRAERDRWAKVIKQSGATAD